MDRDLLFKTIPELAKLIKGKKVSPVEVTQNYLKAIEKDSPKLNAFVTVTAELALKEAKLAETELTNGNYRGPLHGIPYAAKDLFSVKGYLTTWGSRVYKEQQFDYDAEVIKRLRNAGAILIGKTAMSELAGGPPFATATGACRTPWDISRWSGGSSCGSGAAVAAGLCAFSLGTETWGSIMTPSSYCGITGLRPTFGRIPRTGAMPLSWTMDKIGVMARTAEDCAVAFKVLSGANDKDLFSIDAPFKFSKRNIMEKISGLRIGFIREDYEKFGEVEVGKAFNEALQVFKTFGIEAEELVLPDYPYEPVATTIIAAEEASIFEPIVRDGRVKDLIDPERRGEVLGGQTITAVDYLKCIRIITQMRAGFDKIFERYDVILGSSTLTTAPPIDAKMSDVFKGGNVIEAAENLTGIPAISIPCGFDKRKLPIGLKIIGRHFGEKTILELAAAFQMATDWHKRKPPLFR
ncbi:MAG: amidase [Bacteroidetes bacterium]|nr:amidase [Bacteroidota bacterium]MBU1422164.1 amidase [Bacteroidota bacterium]MBU2471482.1 amidase [Bacteroidota bacterium]MBU2636326.1 amidase [Bacteroidota bacterium]